MAVNFEDDIFMDKIIDHCPSLLNEDYFNAKKLNVDYDINQDDILHYQKLYYDKVEQGNRYIKELKDIEKKYLVKKYGNKIYDFLIMERNNYVEKISSSNCSNSNIIEDISYQFNLYKNLNESSLSKNIEIYKNNMKSLNNEIVSLVTKENNDKRKIKYIQDMSSDVKETNFKVNVLYYFIVLCLFIYLYANDIINWYKNRFLYIIVVLFPLLYPFLYDLLYIIYEWINKNINNYGPQKSFLNENDNLQFFNDTISEDI